MEEIKEKKGFWASLFTHKPCDCYTKKSIPCTSPAGVTS